MVCACARARLHLCARVCTCPCVSKCACVCVCRVVVVVLYDATRHGRIQTRSRLGVSIRLSWGVYAFGVRIPVPWDSDSARIDYLCDEIKVGYATRYGICAWRVLEAGGASPWQEQAALPYSRRPRARSGLEGGGTKADSRQ